METVKMVSWAEGTAPVGTGTAVFEVFIKTTPERLWDAITDPSSEGSSVSIDSRSDSGTWPTGPSPGVPSVFEVGDRPEHRSRPAALVGADLRGAVGRGGEGLRTDGAEWEIEPVGTWSRLTVVHRQLHPGPNPQLYSGWPMIFSGLKTLLETGGLLRTTPGSLPVQTAGESARRKRGDRRLAVIEFVTLDGVAVLSLGSPDEDRDGGFEYGGWGAALRRRGAQVRRPERA